MKLISTKSIIFYTVLLLPAIGLSQTTVGGGSTTGGSNYSSAISTAVPFLNITPDSRSGALGDAGVALSPDVNANYWNPSKLAFLENNNDVSISYSPWLRQLVPDISLSYVSYAHKIDSRNSFGASLRYFNYGTINFTGTDQSNLGTYSPNEFQVNGSFARKFGDDFSLGLTLGFIHSSLSNAIFATGSGQQTNAANGVSAGVSLYYTSKTQEFGNDAIFSFGTNVSNIGSKLSYSNNGTNYYLPANLKIGAANTWILDDYNQLTLTMDLNKLLVPSSPNSDVSVPEGVFQSFSDVPVSQEFQEITVSTGLEYWYNQLFALRAGYFYQNPNKGDAHYFTMGVGFKYQEYTFDFSYLAASQQNSALANTLRFTLIANFGGTKNADKNK